MEHLETFEAAAASLGLDPKALPVVTGLDEAIGKATIAAYKLFIISKAAWKGNKIDWNDNNQYKYYPWWDMETYPNNAGSGAGFSFVDDVCDGSSSYVGSRLCYPDRETVKFVAEKHIGLYREMMVIE